MKVSQKDSEKIVWDQMRSPSGAAITAQNRALPKLMVWLILFVSVTYVVYTLKLVSTSRACDGDPFFITTPRQSLSSSVIAPNTTVVSSPSIRNQTVQNPPPPTELRHIVFGIAASAKLWNQRKEYIKLWWKPKEMRGIVWLDDVVNKSLDDNLPPVKISGDTSRFSYINKQGHRSAIRISRIVSETLRLGMTNVRWFVMGDDDTVFVTENLVRVLSKYDHNQYYYIGSLSESHLQNIYFSYGMAYGGGGFAISYPLARALDKMQDRCIQRYPGLYGSDDRMQACMAELGVPLTKELGFHQVSANLSASNLIPLSDLLAILSFLLCPLFLLINSLFSLCILVRLTKMELRDSIPFIPVYRPNGNVLNCHRRQIISVAYNYYHVNVLGF